MRRISRHVVWFVKGSGELRRQVAVLRLVN
jgi:hypothetical protein